MAGVEGTKDEGCARRMGGHFAELVERGGLRDAFQTNDDLNHLIAVSETLQNRRFVLNVAVVVRSLLPVGQKKAGVFFDRWRKGEGVEEWRGRAMEGEGWEGGEGGGRGIEIGSKGDEKGRKTFGVRSLSDLVAPCSDRCGRL